MCTSCEQQLFLGEGIRLGMGVGWVKGYNFYFVDCYSIRIFKKLTIYPCINTL